MRLNWDEPKDRLYHDGLDRCVLYGADTAVAWDGLTLVSPSNTGSLEPQYFDGTKFRDRPVVGDFVAQLSAFTYPDLLEDMEGKVNLVDGFRTDGGQAQEFNLSYRTLVGNDLEGFDFGYRIHFLYNLTAVPTSRKYASTGGEVRLSEFTWDVAARPQNIVGFRPTSHVYVDSRFAGEEFLAVLQDLILYGSEWGDPVMPDIDQLIAYSTTYATEGQ